MHIYRFTNTANGKVYVGKSTHPAGWREREHLHSAVEGSDSCPAFYNAIRKYGAAVFTTEILYMAKTAYELSQMETFFIVLHQSHIKENGYNLTLGGDGVTMSEVIRCKIRASMKGKRNALGIKRSEETKERTSRSLLGNKNRLGSKSSQSTRNKLRISQSAWMSSPEGKEQRLRMGNARREQARQTRNQD